MNGDLSSAYVCRATESRVFSAAAAVFSLAAANRRQPSQETLPPLP